MKKILVVTLSNLGDVVLTLPVFQALRQAFPGASIDAVVGDGARSVFEGDPRIRKIIPYVKRAPLGRRWAYLQSVRAERYDLIVDLRYSLIGLLGGAPRRNRYRLFSPRREHRLDRHFRSLAGIVDLPLEAVHPKWLKENTAPSPLPEGPGRWVVAAPGSKSDTKKWPAEAFAKTIDKLILNDGCRVALAGDAHDAADAARVRGAMKGEAVDLCGRTDFGALCGAIRRAALVLTNDSAPLHIAEALGVPALAVFGPTDAAKYGPRGPRSAAIQKPFFCVPCEEAQCRFRHECLAELAPDEVYKKAVQMLSGSAAAAPREKILVIRLDRIGDLVLSLPAVAAIRKKFPGASISLMTRPATAPLVEGHPLIDEVIPYRYEKGGRHSSLVGGWRFVREIRRRCFNKAFILRPSNRAMVVPYLAGIPERIGLEAGPAFLLTKTAEDRRHEGSRHEADYALDVVRAGGVADTRELFPELSVDQEASEAVLKMTGRSAEKFVALHPGASCESKRWPAERFAQLGKMIASRTSYSVALVGGEGEQALGKFLRETIGPRAMDLTGRLGLKETAAFLKRCDALVSNDSGPVHIAAAVGTPTLTLFGRNRPGLGAPRWHALGRGHETIQKDVGCVVCLAHRCTIGFECLRAIEPEEVFARLEAMLTPQKERTAA